jgi:hypothetical protein
MGWSVLDGGDMSRGRCGAGKIESEAGLQESVGMNVASSHGLCYAYIDHAEHVVAPLPHSL